MTDADCPQPVQAFIASNIDSVVQLEVLLLLYATPDRSWTGDLIGRELRIDPAWVETQLAQLCSRGLLQCTDGAYQYKPATPALHDAVVGLAKAYADRRVTVISLIYSKPPTPPPPTTPMETPTDPLKSFLDAFRLRKDDHNG